jgi:hypothetical protein
VNRALACLLVALCGVPARPGAAAAQSAAELLSAARRQIENLDVDSATVLLRRVAAPWVHATTAERATAALLIGAGELMRGHEPRARAAFREALSLDPVMRADSFAALHSDLLRVFGAVRAGLLALTVTVPPDTMLPLDSGALLIGVRTSHRVLVSVVVTAEDSGGAAAAYQDSQMVSGLGQFVWRPLPPLPGAPAGRFALRVVAREVEGGSDSVVTARGLVVGRAAADTEPLPPPPPASAFLPESTLVRVRRSRSLAVGLAFGAGAATLAVLGSQSQGGRDARAFVVGGAVSLGGLIGFLRGGYVHQPNAANADRNRDLREESGRQRAAVVRANADRLAHAGIRVTVAAAEKVTR